MSDAKLDDLTAMKTENPFQLTKLSMSDIEDIEVMQHDAATSGWPSSLCETLARIVPKLTADNRRLRTELAKIARQANGAAL